LARRLSAAGSVGSGRLKSRCAGCCAPLACARSRALVWREAVYSAMRRVALLVEVGQLIAAEALL
jgi:hypothetical protein